MSEALEDEWRGLVKLRVCDPHEIVSCLEELDEAQEPLKILLCNDDFGETGETSNTNTAREWQARDPDRMFAVVDCNASVMDMVHYHLAARRGIYRGSFMRLPSYLYSEYPADDVAHITNFECFAMVRGGLCLARWITLIVCMREKYSHSTVTFTRCVTRDCFESIDIARNVVERSHPIIKKFDIVVATPPGVSSGRSAGLMFGIAFNYLARNRTLPLITATGVLNEDGTVGEIDNLAEKCAAADFAGYEFMYIPASMEAPKTNITRIIPVETLTDAIEHLDIIYMQRRQGEQALH